MAKPLETQSQRVARAQAALTARGGRRLNMALQPDAAQALHALMEAGYGRNRARSAAAVISRALLDAQSAYTTTAQAIERQPAPAVQQQTLPVRQDRN